MKKFVLVYNPVSGNAAFCRQLDPIIEAFLRRDVMLVPYRTRPDGDDLAAFIREAAPAGVLSAGGDGTLNAVASAVVGERLDLPVAVIGSGTSNDFATYLGVRDDLESYFDRIVQGKTRRFDIGIANGRYFVNVASAGMLTSVAHEVSVRLKHAVGKAAYYLAGIGEIPRFRSMHLRIDADGIISELDAYLFVIVNSSLAGSMKNVAKRAKTDDGRLDLLAVKKCGMAQFMSLAKRVIAGTMDEDDENVLYVQASRFTVTADESTESDLDGERGPMLPLEVETMQRALTLFV